MRPHRITLYRDHAGKYRWKRQAGNWRVVDRSDQGFADKGYCTDDMKSDNPDWAECEVLTLW